MQRRDPFAVGRRPGYAHGIGRDSRYLGIHVCDVLDHQVEQLRIHGCDPCSAATAAYPPAIWVNAGSKQEGAHTHADDVWIGALVQQGARDFRVVADQGTKQRCGSRAEKRIAETAALTTGTALVELRIRIDACCQQRINNVHARYVRTTRSRRSTATAAKPCATWDTASASRTSTARGSLTSWAASSGDAAKSPTACRRGLLINNGVERRASIHIPKLRI